MDRIENKLDRIDDSLREQAIQLARYNTTLEEHVKRSEMLEALVLPIDRYVNTQKTIVKWSIRLLTSSALLGLISRVLKVL